MMQCIALNENWKFYCLGSTKGVPSGINIPTKKQPLKAKVPGTIHTDLLRNKIIDDPFYSDNELKLQWISDLNWVYENHFDLPDGFDTRNPVYLVFEGLDTVTDIFLNNHLIGSTKNMFRGYRFDISSVVKKKKNILAINFTSPVGYAKDEEEKHGKLPVELRSERVFIRKAQYSFGWDWGPTFITSGIWKNVRLENVQSAAIENINFETLGIRDNFAALRVSTTLNQAAGKKHAIRIELLDGDKPVHVAMVHADAAKTLNHHFKLTAPKLWYPNGSGEPHLYALTVTLLENGEVLSRKEKKVGIRTIELQRKDDSGHTFRFIVNGKPVFMQGVNWIPCHSFLPEAGRETYERLLKLACDANMNMARVWGGGTYEQDMFYDLCDEMGIMVWQDFMFACAAYPEHKEFKSEVEAEVRENVIRLRSHPCLAIWCGNNENEWIWTMKYGNDYRDMPGHTLFAKLIPSIVAVLDPLRPYHVSSPFGPGSDPNSMESGNRHQWNIWSAWIDYSQVKDDHSRFVTEFGFQGPANRNTLEKALPKSEWSIQSKGFEFHNKQIEGNERIIRFLAAHLPLRTSWKDFLYLAQLNQGFALQTCLEHWRMHSPETNGAIIWQINDCWPVSSWALVDSALQPKLAYHLVKNTFAPAALSFKKEQDGYSVVCINNANALKKVTIDVSVVLTGKGRVQRLTKMTRVLRSDTCEVIYRIPLKDGEASGIYVATLYDEHKNILHRAYAAPQPWKHIKLPPAKIKMSITKKDNEYFVSLKAGNPAFFVDLYGDTYEFSQRGVILMPGEQIEVPFKLMKKTSPDKSDITIQTLNDYLQ